MSRLFIFIALMGLTVVAAHEAQASCYTPTEIEAEQGIRIHSELMVIGLTCQKMPGVGGNLYAKYQAFSQKNQATLALYENNLMSYYRKQGHSNPERQLIDLRTAFANAISRQAVQTSMVGFCKHFGSRVDQALQMDQSTFRKWAQHVWPEQPTTVRACR